MQEIALKEMVSTLGGIKIFIKLATSLVCQKDAF